MKHNKHLVVFQPAGLRSYVEEGETIKEASQKAGVGVESVCGGQATCGKCKVKIEEGLVKEYDIESQMEHLSPMSEREKRFFATQGGANSYRLACVARIRGDVVVFVPDESRAGKQIVCKAATKRDLELKPAVKKYYVEVAFATLDNPLADWERLQSELSERFNLSNLTIDYRVLRSLQKTMRTGNWKVTASLWMGREVIKIEPGFVEKGYGLAVDIGTTTVVGYLCDLASGEVVCTESMMNPQVTYGDDVMSRITYTLMNKNGLRSMNQAIIQGLNQIAGQAALSAGIKHQDILDITVVGNTCMHHLFLGIDPEYLGQAPFVPSIHHSLVIKARDLGLKVSAGAYAHVLPVEAGFVGADNVAVLIAEEPYNNDEMTLIVDIGTNGELVLGNRKKLLSCSCATGPAFEGAHIRHGMRAAPGAIETVEIDPDSKEVRFKVIGKAGWNTELKAVEAKGICGSGIIDAIAQMLKAGILQKSGRVNSGMETPRLRFTSDGGEFVIAWASETSINQDIVICQADVRAVQLAKGALYAGVKLMMRRLGVTSLNKVILAGAFGSCINKESALVMGLFPDCSPGNVYAVGNAAGDGARIALLNVDKRREADEIARRVEYIELTAESDFTKEFIEAMYFPHM